MKKFIWDLDETLLSADFRKEDDFFKEQILDEKVDEFIKNKVKYLMEYERMFFKYDTKLLSEFLTLRSGLKIDEKIIKDVNPNETVMIGDNIINDVLVPRSIGITSYHYDPLGKNNDKNKIKTLKKIKEMY